MWRPEKDWNNPYKSVQMRYQDQQEAMAFEAGADAMLEALKSQGTIMNPEQMELLAPDRKFPYGWLVFIPYDKK